MTTITLTYDERHELNSHLSTPTNEVVGLLVRSMIEYPLGWHENKDITYRFMIGPNARMTILGSLPKLSYNLYLKVKKVLK